MKTLLKLLVVCAIVFGAYRAGMAEYRFSRLKDSTHSMLVLGTETPTEELQQQILERASDLGLPVSAENVGVTRDGVRTTAKVAFRQQVELFPGVTYPRDYSFSDEISPAALR
jgi:hypothetical protein